MAIDATNPPFGGPPVAPPSPAPTTAGRAGGTAAISVLGLTSQQMASFVITLLAAGFLGVADYGVYTLANVFVEFIVLLTYTGYFHFVVNSGKSDRIVLSTMFWTMLAIGVLGGAGLIVSARPLASVFDAPALAPVLVAFGLMQPLASVVGWGSAALTRAGLMRRYFLILIASNLGGLVAGCVVLVLWQSLFALVAYRAFRITLALALFLAAVPERPRRVFDRGLTMEATRYAAGLYGARFLSFFSNFGTDLILAFIFSTSEAGLYRFANRLATGLVDIVAQPLRIFAQRNFGAAARTGAPLDVAVAEFFGASVFLTGGVALVALILGGAAVETLFRPEYGAAIAALSALAIRAAARTGQNTIEPTFAARRDTRPAMYHNLALTAAVLGAIALVAPMGVTALAQALAAVQVLSLPFSLWVVHRVGGVHVLPCLHLGARALAILALYAAGLVLLRDGIGELSMGPLWRLALGGVAALGLSLPALAAALRCNVLSPAMFRD